MLIQMTLNKHFCILYFVFCITFGGDSDTKVLCQNSQGLSILPRGFDIDWCITTTIKSHCWIKLHNQSIIAGLLNLTSASAVFNSSLSVISASQVHVHFHIHTAWALSATFLRPHSIDLLFLRMCHTESPVHSPLKKPRKKSKKLEI